MKKPYKAYFLITKNLFFGLILMVMLLAMPFFVSGQVFVPRAGFPYCQPFTGSGDPNSLPFTIAKGNTVLNYTTGAVSPDRPLVLTGNSLELTPDSDNERGYILIDLPFSSEYGIKASFEYFIFKDLGNAGFLGDGFSFFLIDGTTTPFEIGGVGGSLGYAPHGPNSGASYSSVGVTGGYMGIGFDVLGNFGNYQEKKYGGFHDPNQFNFSTPNSDIRFYPDAVSIRGPLEAGDLGRDNGAPATNTPAPPFNSYQFKGGKIVYFNPADTVTAVGPTQGNLNGYPGANLDRIELGSGDLYLSNPSFFLGTSYQFKISTGLKPEDVNCGTMLPSGYRKVFIDLFPTGIPAEPYDITVEMLVGGNPSPVKILDNVRYKGAAPTTLKVGFAASTGGTYYSNHHIRNLAVQVSSVEDAAKPLPPALFREVCIDETNTIEFPFCVELPSSANAFIQCIQLYDTNPGVGDNDFDSDVYECGISGFCALRCNEAFKKLDAFDAFGNKVGEFIAELSDEVEVGKFNQAQIRFVRTDLSFFGTITAWYKIVDNFGLESDGTPITITINPIPEIVSRGTPLDPTCDGQNDGELNGVVIKNLVSDYTIEFYDENNDPITISSFSEVIEVTGPDTYITATFNLSGLNLGQIFVRAINPSSESLGPVCNNNDDIDADSCENVDKFLIDFDQVRGTPVELDPYEDEICEGEVFFVSPSIDPKYNPSNLVVPFEWFADENRTQPLPLPGTSGPYVIDGTPVTIAVAANGELSVTGLKASGLIPKDYFFYVETSFQDNSGVNAGNFCPYNGVVAIVATVKVFPELQTSFTATPDWCRTSAGAIAVTAQGGTGSKTFSLYLVGNNNPSATQIVNGNSYTFTGLFPGDYEVEVFTQNPTCAKIISPITIEGPAIPLTLTPVSTQNSYCGIANGSLKFNLLGGNLPYAITINGNPLSSPVINGNEYTLNNLAAGTYIIRVVDDKACQIQISQAIGADPLSQFGTTDDEICEGEVAVVSPTVVTLSSSVPVYKWYYKDDGGNYIQITNGTNPSGVTFAIDGSNKLSVSNLTPQATPYTYYLNVSSGTKVCDQGYIPAEILVNPKPIPAASLITQVTCNGAANGIIQAQLTSGNLGDFQYSLIGNNGVNRPFASNSGLFNLLPPGIYELKIKSAKGCEVSVPNLIITEPSPLLVNQVSKTDATCSLNNGEIRFNVTGATPDGTGKYSIKVNGNDLSTFGSSLITNSPSDFTLSNLAPGPYKIEVEDTNGCKKELTITLLNTAVPVFDVQDVTVCEGTDAVLTPLEVSNTIGAIPQYGWFYKDGGNFQPITNGLNLSGVTFAIDGSNKLSVSNLAPQATPYTYYLNVTGTKVCDQGYIPAEILVNPKPIPAASLITQVTCNGAANGIIQAQLTSGNLGDFQYSLIGNNGVNRPFTSNSGLFNLLPPGTYELKIKSAKGCEVSVPNLIITEPSELLLNQVSKTDATCALNNGEIRFNVTGATPDGTGKYSIKVNGNDLSTFGSSLITNSPSDFTISELAPGIYQIEAEDVNGCKKALSITLLNTAVPVFDVQDVTVCEGTDAVLTPQVVSNTIGAIPVYTWSYENPSSPGQFIQINNGDVVKGATHTISNGVLTIKGLKYDVSNHAYFLSVTGTKVCPPAPIQAEVKVLKIPAAVFETVAVSCFGGTNGQVNLTSVVPAGPHTFTLVETGATNSTGNFSNLKAGTYTIRIKETGSPCQSEWKVVITEPAKLELLNPLKSDPTCNENNGSVSFDVKGGVKDYQILINGKPIVDYSFGQTVDRYEIKNLAPGTYSVQITDANGCVVDKPNLFVLTNDDGLTVNINPLVEEKCVGSSAILSPVFGTALPVTPTFKWYKDAGLLQPITSSPTPDSDNITYQINSTGALTINGLQVGDYKYYLEVSGQGICTLVEEANVKIVPQILADIVVEDITCFGQKDGLIKITPSGGNGNFEIRLNSGAYSAKTDYSNLGAGKYTVDIRNDIGCVTSYQVEVKGPTGPISINNPSIIRASCDLDNGSIEDLVISGGWNAYLVEWRFGSATGPIIPGDITGAQNLAPGTYFLLVSDIEGCAATFTFVIGESSDPVYAVVPPINSCLGSKISIRPIHIAPNPSLPPAAATEIRWYTDPGQTGLISDGEDPSIAGVTYTIDDTDWLNPLLEIEGLPVGIHDFYFFVVCTGQEIKIETTVYSTPDVAIETDPITCFGDSNGKIRIVSGDDPIYTYSMNSGAPITKSALEAMSLGAGVYNIVIATPAGCSQDLNLTIEGPSAALVSSPLTKIDPGCGAPNGKLELVVTGGWLPYTLNISKDGTSIGNQVFSQSNILIDGFTQGVYQIVITDSEGCTLTTNSVTMVDGPTQVLVGEEAICESSNAVLVPSLDPAASGATFQWFFNQALTLPIVSSPSPAADGNIYQINASTGVLSVSGLASSPTAYSYYVTAAGSTVCQGFIGEGKVRVYGSPVAVASVQNEVCFGDGGEITINASGGSGSYTYSLNGGTFGNSNVFQVPTGSHQVEVQTPEGCTFILSNIQVTGPVADLASGNFQVGNPSCDLDNGEVRFNISGGYEPYTITYTKNGVDAGSLNLPSTGMISIPNLGEGVYAFKVKDSQGCEITSPTSLTLTEEPSVITASDDFICEGETAQLIPSLPTNILNPSYTWSFDTEGKSPINSGQSNGVTFAINPNGMLDISGLAAASSPYTYYVMASGQGVCGLSPKPVKVIVNGIPTLRVSNPSVVCDPKGTVDLTEYIEGFNPTVYDYNVLSPTGASMAVDELGAVAVNGDYRVSSSVKGTVCWNQPQRIKVLIAEEELVASFQYEVDLGGGIILTNGEIQIQEDVAFMDFSQGDVLIWQWEFGDGNSSGEQNPVHQFEAKGTYTVKLTTIDSIGCVSSYEIIVNVFDDYKIIVPNAFTPNGLENKYFKPYYRGISSMEFYIFNTWGELIFESNSLEDLGWDGTLNGTPTPNGNYVYKGRFVSRSGEVITKAGVFILIR
jgi:gliding motility-associated-like protein